jgi:hypothetical protein
MPQAGQIFDPADVPFIRARGFRDSVFPTASTWTTTEAVVYRFDNITVKAGKVYIVETGMLNLVASVVNDIATLRLRYKESGPAGTSDTQFAQFRQKQTDTSNGDTGRLSGVYVPAADLTTFSVALTLARQTAGVSSTGVRLWGSGTEPVHIWIREEDDPGISGTAF